MVQVCFLHLVHIGPSDKNTINKLGKRIVPAESENMGMLDRYKKKGGFIQLLTLIETSGKQKQEQFLNLIAQESKAWEEGIKKYMLSVDRIMGWQPQFRAEIFSRVQPLTLATVLHGLPPEKLDAVLECMGTSEKRKIMNVISERTPTPGEKATCNMKLITETRGFCMGGVIKLDKVDPEIAIPENVEEQLNHANITSQLSSTSSSSSAPGKPEELVFDLDRHKHTTPSDVKAGTAEEIEFLKKKVNQLVQDNNHMKHELNVARGKLEQIKKIA